MIYKVGNQVLLRGTYVATDLKGTKAPADPAQVYLDVTDNTGSLTHYVYGVDSEIIRDSAGRYRAQLTATAEGIWYYRWFSTGSGENAKRRLFRVKAA